MTNSSGMDTAPRSRSTDSVDAILSEARFARLRFLHDESLELEEAATAILGDARLHVAKKSSEVARALSPETTAKVGGGRILGTGLRSVRPTKVGDAPCFAGRNVIVGPSVNGTSIFIGPILRQYGLREGPSREAVEKAMARARGEIVDDSTAKEAMNDSVEGGITDDSTKGETMNDCIIGATMDDSTVEMLSTATSGTKDDAEMIENITSKEEGVHKKSRTEHDGAVAETRDDNAIEVNDCVSFDERDRPGSFQKVKEIAKSGPLREESLDTEGENSMKPKSEDHAGRDDLKLAQDEVRSVRSTALETDIEVVLDESNNGFSFSSDTPEEILVEVEEQESMEIKEVDMDVSIDYKKSSETSSKLTLPEDLGDLAARKIDSLFASWEDALHEVDGEKGPWEEMLGKVPRCLGNDNRTQGVEHEEKSLPAQSADDSEHTGAECWDDVAAVYSPDPSTDWSESQGATGSVKKECVGNEDEKVGSKSEADIAHSEQAKKIVAEGQVEEGYENGSPTDEFTENTAIVMLCLDIDETKRENSTLADVVKVDSTAFPDGEEKAATANTMEEHNNFDSTDIEAYPQSPDNEETRADDIVSTVEDAGQVFVTECKEKDPEAKALVSLPDSGVKEKDANEANDVPAFCLVTEKCVPVYATSAKADTPDNNVFDKEEHLSTHLAEEEKGPNDTNTETDKALEKDGPADLSHASGCEESTVSITIGTQKPDVAPLGLREKEEGMDTCPAGGEGAAPLAPPVGGEGELGGNDPMQGHIESPGNITYAEEESADDASPCGRHKKEEPDLSLNDKGHSFERVRSLAEEGKGPAFVVSTEKEERPPDVFGPEVVELPGEVHSKETTVPSANYPTDEENVPTDAVSTFEVEDLASVVPSAEREELLDNSPAVKDAGCLLAAPSLKVKPNANVSAGMNFLEEKGGHVDGAQSVKEEVSIDAAPSGEEELENAPSLEEERDLSDSAQLVEGKQNEDRPPSFEEEELSDTTSNVMEKNLGDFECTPSVGIEEVTNATPLLTEKEEMPADVFGTEVAELPGEVHDKETIVPPANYPTDEENIPSDTVSSFEVQNLASAVPSAEREELLDNPSPVKDAGCLLAAPSLKMKDPTDAALSAGANFYEKKGEHVDGAQSVKEEVSTDAAPSEKEKLENAPSLEEEGELLDSAQFIEENQHEDRPPSVEEREPLETTPHVKEDTGKELSDAASCRGEDDPIYAGPYANSNKPADAALSVEEEGQAVAFTDLRQQESTDSTLSMYEEELKYIDFSVNKLEKRPAGATASAKKEKSTEVLPTNEKIGHGSGASDDEEKQFVGAPHDTEDKESADVSTIVEEEAVMDDSPILEQENSVDNDKEEYANATSISDGANVPSSTGVKEEKLNLTDSIAEEEVIIDTACAGDSEAPAMIDGGELVDSAVACVGNDAAFAEAKHELARAPASPVMKECTGIAPVLKEGELVGDLSPLDKGNSADAVPSKSEGENKGVPLAETNKPVNGPLGGKEEPSCAAFAKQAEEPRNCYSAYKRGSEPVSEVLTKDKEKFSDERDEPSPSETSCNEKVIEDISCAEGKWVSRNAVVTPDDDYGGPICSFPTKDSFHPCDNEEDLNKESTVLSNEQLRVTNDETVSEQEPFFSKETERTAPAFVIETGPDNMIGCMSMTSYNGESKDCISPFQGGSASVEYTDKYCVKEEDTLSAEQVDAECNEMYVKHFSANHLGGRYPADTIDKYSGVEAVAEKDLCFQDGEGGCQCADHVPSSMCASKYGSVVAEVKSHAAMESEERGPPLDRLGGLFSSWEEALEDVKGEENCHVGEERQVHILNADVKCKKDCLKKDMGQCQPNVEEEPEYPKDRLEEIELVLAEGMFPEGSQERKPVPWENMAEGEVGFLSASVNRSESSSCISDEIFFLEKERGRLLDYSWSENESLDEERRECPMDCQQGRNNEKKVLRVVGPLRSMDTMSCTSKAFNNGSKRMSNAKVLSTTTSHDADGMGRRENSKSFDISDGSEGERGSSDFTTDDEANGSYLHHGDLDGATDDESFFGKKNEWIRCGLAFREGRFLMGPGVDDDDSSLDSILSEIEEMERLEGVNWLGWPLPGKGELIPHTIFKKL